MGLYDSLTWHGDLPDLPSGTEPYLLAFQTKSLEDCQQRIFEVTEAGQLQLRKFIGERYRYEDYSAELVAEMQTKFQERQMRRLAGLTLDEKDYSTTKSNYSGELVFYTSYGQPPNGWLEYTANFETGTVKSVCQTQHRAPDEQAWRERKGGTVAQFIVKKLGPEACDQTETE